MKPHWYVAAVGILALGLVSASSAANAAWVARGGADASFAWHETPDFEHLTGPILYCVEPGKTVAFSITVDDGFREGQTATIRFSNGVETIELIGQVEEAPVGFSLGTTLGASHKLLGLFRGSGTLTVQVGDGPKAAYSLKTAPAAFARFAKACRLSGGAAAAPSGAGGGKSAPKALSAEDCARRWDRTESDGMAQHQVVYAPCRDSWGPCPDAVRCAAVRLWLPLYAERDRLLAMCPSLAADTELVEKHQRYWGITRRFIGEHCHS